MNEENDLESWIDHAEDDFNLAGKSMRGDKPSITTRYPGASPTIEDAKEALKIAKTIRKFSRAYLGLK